jgi:hypothetical protein
MLSSEELLSVSCHGCGSYEPSLRQSTHPTVISTLVKASQTARAGIWCARCRGIEAAKATMVSLLAGWWSLRGPMLTIAALRTNLLGGAQRPTTNADMLRAIARLEHERKNPELAAMFATEAHATQPQRENSRLLDELRRGGYRATAATSPWKFAPHAAVAVFAMCIATVGWQALPDGGEPEVVAEVPVTRAAVTPRPTIAVRKTEINPNASVDELKRQLTSKYDRDLALAYYQALLRQAKTDIPMRVRRGEPLMSIEFAIADVAIHPGLAPLLNEPGRRGSYETLTSVMRESTRYYNGGGTVEMLERTAGESIDVTRNIAFAAIVSDIQGNTERAQALSNAVDARAQSLMEMRRDLQIRGVVIAATAQAIDSCLGATPPPPPAR